MGVGAIAAIAFALVAVWLTLLAARAARNVARAADSAEKSSVAAARAARESVEAATESRRRAEADTRVETAGAMPIIYAWATGVDSTPEESTFAVRYTNIGDGVAVNVVLRLWDDDTAGPIVGVRFPVGEVRGLPPAVSETQVPHPRGGATLDSPYVIEAVYQDGLGRHLATRSHHDGTVDCYRIEAANGGRPGRYEPVFVGSRDVPAPGFPQ